MRLCYGCESRNFYWIDKFMAIITNILLTARGYTFLALTAIILAGSSNVFATGNNAAERKARTLEAEQKLSDLGYWITNVDGASDGSTRQAILAFQKVEGLKRTGVLDDQVIEAIRQASRPAAKYSGAAHVEIDITRQVILLVNSDGEVNKVLSTSTGSGARYFSEGKW